MFELPKSYTDKGFFIVSPLYYKKRNFLKCGNTKNDNIYFFEKIENNILEITDNELLQKLIERFSHNSDDKIY